MKRFILSIAMLAMTAGSAWAQTYNQRFDTNRDGQVSISDVTYLVGYLLGKVTPYEYVDLDLPSGTLWATCNVGAESPEEYGDYFAWGETETKSNYDWSTYAHCGGSSTTLTKYCTDSSYGTVDNLEELELSDDAAYVCWGRMWTMPSKEQFEELINSSYTTTTWTTQNGVNGRLITSKSNGNSIFLPAAGYKDSSLNYGGSFGYYRSRTLSSSSMSSAYILMFNSAVIITSGDGRRLGMPVRPVRYQTPGPTSVTDITLSETSLLLGLGTTQTLTATVRPNRATDKSVTWVSSNPAVATVSADGLVTGTGEGSCTITCTAADGSGVSATCQVTVSVIPVSGITLSKTSFSLLQGTTPTLTAIVFPANATDKSLTWVSSNPAVATVSATGLLTPVALGSCTITCIAADGSGVVATCRVTVKDPTDHDYVDLDLPSGTMWATCNVGASSPEEYGDHFAWGETETKAENSYSYLNNVYYYNGEHTKYCTDSDYGYNGYVDNLTELELSDDAAYVNWGSNWRTPSDEQIQELINSEYTTTSWTTLNGVNGYQITSKSNGNSIFLPAAGDCWRDEGLRDEGEHGCYWSRTLIEYWGATMAYDLNFWDWEFGRGYEERPTGYSVRPVQTPSGPFSVTGITLSETSLSLGLGTTQTLTATVHPNRATDKSVTWESSNTAVAMVNAAGLVIPVGLGSCTITCTAADGSGVSATCQVTVTDAILVTSIELSNTSVSLHFEDTLQLTATVLPANATNKSVKWESSDEDIATVSATGLVKWGRDGFGTCTITCTAADGSGVSATCEVEVYAE